MPRPDFSNFVAHFTKSNAAVGNNQNRQIPQTAKERLIGILNSGTIFTTRMPWTNKQAVCFTECPFYSLISHKRQYSPYGIGFTKSVVFNSGGGPAIYIRDSLHQIQVDNFTHNTRQDVRGFHRDVHAFVTPFRPAYGQGIQNPCDYSHEREWRTSADFNFKYEQIEFITVDSYSDIEAINSQLQTPINNEKFIVFSMIEKIEALWPTHLL